MRVFGIRPMHGSVKPHNGSAGSRHPTSVSRHAGTSVFMIGLQHASHSRAQFQGRSSATRLDG